MAPSTAKRGSTASLWLAANPSKRWAEVFFLAYSPFWITWALCVLVPFKLYDYLDETGYLLVGLAAALPCFLLPLALPNKADKGKPWHQWYWVKWNLWIAIFSYIGNYFWTHYFFTLLGAAYTFPAHLLNGVPVALYLMTHAYFCFYHAMSNLVLRRVENLLIGQSLTIRKLARVVVVFVLAYATAYMETLTIAHFPYYTFVDRSKMYTVGSLFYAIYFFASFPMFFRIDEEPSAKKWTLGQVALDSLAAGMLVTLVLDTWRIAVGGIVQSDKATAGLTWTTS